MYSQLYYLQSDASRRPRATNIAVWRQLSPMLLGPVALATPRCGVRAAGFENAWQYSKVHAVGPLGQPFIDANGEPNGAYYSTGWESPVAVRFPKRRADRPRRLRRMGPHRAGLLAC